MRKALASLRKAAHALPDVDEGVACEGTALEKITYRVKKKAFLFVSNNGDALDVMLKLDLGLVEATQLGRRAPGTYRVGKGGWVRAKFAPNEDPPAGLLERWLTESHRIVGGGPATARATNRTAKKTATAKGTKAKTRTTARETAKKTKR